MDHGGRERDANQHGSRFKLGGGRQSDQLGLVVELREEDDAGAEEEGLHECAPVRPGQEADVRPRPGTWVWLCRSRVSSAAAGWYRPVARAACGGQYVDVTVGDYFPFAFRRYVKNVRRHAHRPRDVDHMRRGVRRVSPRGQTPCGVKDSVRTGAHAGRPQTPRPDHGPSSSGGRPWAVLEPFPSPERTARSGYRFRIVRGWRTSTVASTKS